MAHELKREKVKMRRIYMEIFEKDEYLVDRMDKEGVDLDDLIEFTSVYSKKRTLKIKRTVIEFATRDMQPFCDSMVKYDLDSLFGERLHFKLSYKESGGVHFFLLESLNNYPFKHNENYSFCSIIEDGDICYLGKNKLRFKKEKKSSIKDTMLNDLLSEKKNIINSNIPILIQGETGTGKTSLAQALHDQSDKSGPFIHLNLSSFSENLLESELFGHEKGAFTGAMASKKGALRSANYGTLFLDEIDSLSLETQTKLLLYLDNQVVRSVGGKDYKTQTRIIFASGKKLEPLVDQGLMRKDFYFRITSGERIQLSSLRREPSLIEYYINLFCINQDIAVSKKLIHFYQTLAWPGNIRQLYGHLNLKVVHSKARKLDFDTIDENLICHSSDLVSLAEQSEIKTMDQIKKEYIGKVYFRLDQNIRKTARTLKICEKSVRKYVSELKEVV
jgi:hypothetical protein